jgi:hypothetical protein
MVVVRRSTVDAGWLLLLLLRRWWVTSAAYGTAVGGEGGLVGDTTQNTCKPEEQSGLWVAETGERGSSTLQPGLLHAATGYLSG